MQVRVPLGARVLFATKHGYEPVGGNAGRLLPCMKERWTAAESIEYDVYEERASF